MEEILHDLGCMKPCKIIGETTNLNWLAGFLSNQQNIPHPSFTWNLKIMLSKRTIPRGYLSVKHVKLQGCYTVLTLPPGSLTVRPWNYTIHPKRKPDPLPSFRHLPFNHHFFRAGLYVILNFGRVFKVHVFFGKPSKAIVRQCVPIIQGGQLSIPTVRRGGAMPRYPPWFCSDV